MTRTVRTSPIIVGSSDGDRNQTVNFGNLTSGSWTIQTQWMNGAVNDGIMLLGIRTNSGQLGFIGYQNAIGPPPNDYNQSITSTNGSDTSGINFLILPYRGQNRNNIPAITDTVGLFWLRGNDSNNGNFGRATLAGGSVTITTNTVTSANQVFCCNATTPLIGPNTPNPVGNVWVDNVIASSSFTIRSTEPSASNDVFWFAINVAQLQGTGNGQALVVLDYDSANKNYGFITLVSGTASLVVPGLTPTSCVYVSTHTPDSTPSNRGFIMSAPDSINGRIDFWSSHNTDGQTFNWWLMETAGGVT